LGLKIDLHKALVMALIHARTAAMSHHSQSRRGSHAWPAARWSRIRGTWMLLCSGDPDSGSP
jgi:hypothetical protein